MTASAHGDRCFDLAFEVDRGGRTFLGAQFVKYPVHVCRGLYVDEQTPEACAVTLQSVSGGLFECDQVAGRIQARPGAQVRVATSASTIVHAMRQAGAEQSVVLAADSGAFLQYMPEPLILFPGSRLRSTTTVSAARDATVLFCESFQAHDPSSQGQPFASLETQVDVTDSDGRLLARDRTRLDGSQWGLGRVGISGGLPVYGSVWIIQRHLDDHALLSWIRDAMAEETTYGGASRLPHQAGLQIRMLCADAVALRHAVRRLHRQVCHAVTMHGMCARSGA